MESAPRRHLFVRASTSVITTRRDAGCPCSPVRPATRPASTT